MEFWWVTGGEIGFRISAGLGIWWSGGRPESPDGRRRDEFPFLFPAALGPPRGPKKGCHKRRPGGAWDRVGCGRRSSGCRCAFLSAFPFGVTVGYGWRSRISRMRRLRYLSRGRLRAEPDPGVTALARSDMRPATGQVAVASPSLSARATAVETGVPHATLPSLKKATRAGDPEAPQEGGIKSKVAPGDFLQGIWTARAQSNEPKSAVTPFRPLPREPRCRERGAPIT